MPPPADQPPQDAPVNDSGQPRQPRAPRAPDAGDTAPARQAQQRQADARAQAAPSQWAALEELPALSFMTALAALASMAINQLVVPGLGTRVARELLGRIEQAGQFAENLAVFAGLIALVASLWSVWRGDVLLNARRRVMFVVFLSILLREVVVATVLDRTHTTREHVYFAVGAASVLCVMVGMRALDLASSLLLRVIAGFATALPLLCLSTIVLELTSDVQLDPWKHRAYETLQGLGEISYLGLLFASFPLLAARGTTARQLLARAAGLLTLVAAGYGLRVAHQALHNDFAILLYHAQRVGLLLERSPALYALPMCLALAGAASALVAGGAARVQAATATLLIFASGYGPRAPGRLLTMTLGFILLARAIAALSKQANVTRTGRD